MVSGTKRWTSALVVTAGLMGSAGVAIAAAGAHLGGGDPARMAAEFLLIHAGVVLAATSSAVSGSEQTGLLVAATVLALSTSLFSADLALAALGGLRPLPLAAPVGGFGMIAGWLLLVVDGCRRLFRKP